MDKLGAGIMSVVGAIIGLAIIATIVSRNSQAPQLVQSLASALSNVIGAATQPVRNPQTVTGNVAGTPSLLNVNSLINGDIDRAIAPLF